ncbi:hypothetical protein [Achromobacter sp. GbtcB20]|uniref:hypothetical protein n=1 Tax=Achromobacter sp. GbtcB20 TaxID=2824765 RepID=UPI001266D132|nr:hypothetical protein [Achromobacter sp. GbtcB20]
MKTTSPSSELSGWRSLGAEAALSAPRSAPDTRTERVKRENAEALFSVFSREDLCGSPPDRDALVVGPVGGTIIIAIVSAAISYWQKYQQVMLKKRSEDTKKDSDAQIVMSPEQFQTAKCVVYVRKAQDPLAKNRADQVEQTKTDLLPGKGDLVIVMKVVRPTGGNGSSISPDHFVLVPVYVSAPNSIALTTTELGITVAIGVTLHQIGEVEGIPTLASLGVASTAVAGVPLDDKASRCVPGLPKTEEEALLEIFEKLPRHIGRSAKQDEKATDRPAVPSKPAEVATGRPTVPSQPAKVASDQREAASSPAVEYACSPTGILPLPMAGGTIVLGIGVQERGSLGFDVDVAEAQIEAIAAALGPLSATLLDGHFKRARVRAEQ